LLSINFSRAGLVFDDLNLLSEALSRLHSLTHLDISYNPHLRLLHPGMLHVVSRLHTFICKDCSLVLPPQALFSTPEENVVIARDILNGKLDLSETLALHGRLTLSHSELVVSEIFDPSTLGPLLTLPIFKYLDLKVSASSSSARSKLVFDVLESVTGM
jgi:hypothetical protein